MDKWEHQASNTSLVTNVPKMHELFEAYEQPHVGYSLYYSVFTNKFKFGFAHPSTD